LFSQLLWGVVGCVAGCNVDLRGCVLLCGVLSCGEQEPLNCIELSCTSHRLFSLYLNSIHWHQGWNISCF